MMQSKHEMNKKYNVPTCAGKIERYYLFNHYYTFCKYLLYNLLETFIDHIF
jgi:hypothetical protein